MPFLILIKQTLQEKVLIFESKFYFIKTWILLKIFETI
jgi:hypothetical protein